MNRNARFLIVGIALGAGGITFVQLREDGDWADIVGRAGYPQRLRKI